jgi:hypothetical protein
MTRLLSALIIIALSLLPALAFAAPAHTRHARSGWHGYGFLPGYHQPPSNSVPVYRSIVTARGKRYYLPNTPSDTTPQYMPRYIYNGSVYYWGHPGFYRGRYNGGSYGPCYSWTPAGPIWNCG